MKSLAIAIGPQPETWVSQAIEAGGGTPTDDLEHAQGLIWTPSGDVSGLQALLARHPGIGWVQLPAAGVERYAQAGVFDDHHQFTCAKGAYREPVAEHALLLALGGLRLMAERLRTRSWGTPAGTSLFDQPVTIVGGGGITEALLELLAPFRVTATVVRRSTHPVPGAARTLTPDRLEEALGSALVVFLAVALTPATTHLIGAAQLRKMRADSWLVNVARGAIVDTVALMDALVGGEIAGAALDVTDPEPLPDGHPLWDMPNCIITPHTADTWEMIRPLLARRIAENVRRLQKGEPLVGLVDPVAGY